jgi:hypothetical protein
MMASVATTCEECEGKRFHALVSGAGHFSQEEAPDETWPLIADFAGA